MATMQSNRRHSQLIKRIDEMQMNPTERERAKTLLLRALTFADAVAKFEARVGGVATTIATAFNAVSARLKGPWSSEAGQRQG